MEVESCGEAITAGGDPTDPPGIARQRDYERRDSDRQQLQGTTFGMA
jgi:hypothetical protein